MTGNAQKSEVSTQELRRGIEAIGDQLNSAVAGNFEFVVDVDAEDTSLAKLQKVVNSTLAAAKGSLQNQQIWNNDLSEAFGRLNAILDGVGDAIITANEHGILDSYNPAAVSVFGYEPEEMVGRGLSVLLPSLREEQHREDPSAALAEDWTARLEGQEAITAQRKCGEAFPVSLSASQLRFCGNTTYILLMRDISAELNLRSDLEAQKKRLEQALEELQRTHTHLLQAQKLESIGQLAAGIAHEINTPTQFVGDNARFLKDVFDDLKPILETNQRLLESFKEGTVDEELLGKLGTQVEEADVEFLLEEVPSAIDAALDGVDRVASIVRAMKDFSHPGVEDKTPIDLNRAIQSTITVARNEWKYVADLITEFDETLPAVTCLPGDLNQVVLNLIVNASHAIVDKVGDDGSGKGEIRVGTRQDGDFVEIRVSDSGTGIPADVKLRIFDPFFTTKEVGKGTGQGLAIAHSVVAEKHGGTIACESEVGEGTTFIVRLPIRGDTSDAE